MDSPREERKGPVLCVLTRTDVESALDQFPSERTRLPGARAAWRDAGPCSDPLLEFPSEFDSPLSSPCEPPTIEVAQSIAPLQARVPAQSYPDARVSPWSEPASRVNLKMLAVAGAIALFVWAGIASGRILNRSPIVTAASGETASRPSLIEHRRTPPIDTRQSTIGAIEPELKLQPQSEGARPTGAGFPQRTLAHRGERVAASDVIPASSVQTPAPSVIPPERLYTGGAVTRFSSLALPAFSSLQPSLPSRPIAAAVLDDAEVTPPATVTDTDLIQDVLSRYRGAFGALDSDAARSVWPTVDLKMLDRAFAQLEEQDFEFDACEISVEGVRAVASCSGRARYVPKIGNKSEQIASRRWRFTLRKASDAWLIDAVVSR